jgi:peptide deformylase
LAIRRVLRYPHPALKQTAPSLSAGEHERFASVAADLVDTMRAHKGCVGLAAPQIGEVVRVVAVDVTDHPRATTCSGLVVLADPTVVSADGNEVAREGCLSIPDLTANVRRATTVKVAGRTLEGETREVDAEGFEARCLLHELDHLDGILFLDRVDSLTADVFRRKKY